MKRQHAEIGVKYWGNEDLLELQAEPLKALDGFFAQYGPCIVQGCGITPSGDVFDIAPGLVVLEGKDHRGETVTMIVPFAGVTGTSLPVFLTLEYEPRVREYGDGKVKPIAYDYTARASTVEPAAGTAFLRITADETPRFVDVLGDERHSFITDVERAVWNAKETPTGAQAKADKALADAKSYADGGDGTTLEAAKADASTKSEAALRNAKSYTDTREGIVRTDYANADASTLVSAKAYADRVVSALVDGSPEALDTLQELAAALGNDPNFATTVMAEIGKRATTEAMNAALAKKLDKSGGTMTGNLVLSDGVKVSNAAGQNIAAFMAFAGTVKRMVYGNINVPTLLLSNGPLKRRTAEPEVNTEYTVWDSGNFPKGSKADCTIHNEGDCNDWIECGFHLCGLDTYAVKIANAPFGNAFGVIVIRHADLTQIAVNYTSNEIKIRRKHWSTGWTKWESLHNSFPKASTTSDGLMSAADKQKLDRLSATSKCYGEISASGGVVQAVGVSKVTKKGTGQYEIFHPYGNSNFVPVVTIKAISGDGNAHDNTPVITEINPSSFIVYTSTGAGKYEDTGFCFITIPITI